jgi:rRNA maturation endonuclease Nob1
MAICNDCNKEMTSVKTNTCTLDTLVIDGKSYKRIPVENGGIAKRCHDCNIIQNKGNYHHYGCDMEVCPKCGGQLISCGCLVEGEDNED